MSHDQAKAELDAGTPPDAICATCPWDRLCVAPPAITRHDIDRMADKVEADTAAQSPDGRNASVARLMTQVVFAGRDAMGKLCPVFTLRLRSPEGRALADSVRAVMQKWNEPT